MSRPTPDPPNPDLIPRHQQSHCAWNGCNDASLHFLPVCEDHAHLIAHVMTTPEDSVKATLIAGATAQKRHLQRERQRRQAEELRATRGAQPGWIYYVLTDDKVKIGYTTDITRRLRAYPPGSQILAVHPGTPDLEKTIHRDFDAHRVAGREWFRPDDDILRHCTAVRAQHGDPTRFTPKVRDPHDTNRIVAGKRINRS